MTVSDMEELCTSSSGTSATGMIRYYRTPGLSVYKARSLLEEAQTKIAPHIKQIETEFCYNIAVADGQELTQQEEEVLQWLLSETFEHEKTSKKSFLDGRGGESSALVEVGPRLTFSTAFSTNAVKICHDCGLTKILRIERSRRYLIEGEKLSTQAISDFADMIHDRMTEQVYEKPLVSFGSAGGAKSVRIIPIMEEGRSALERLNTELGLGFDDWDLDYYTSLFKDKLKRNPTDVECFDMGQSNSEHSRHWFFGGRMVLNGEEKPESLFKLVKQTLTEERKKNSVIAFHDNSSAIQGFPTKMLRPSAPGHPSAFEVEESVQHPILTAETHNFPCGVAPFPGAETGTGGRIRDVHSTGTGAAVVAGISAYSVGNLYIPDYTQPWEDEGFQYPHTMATPLEIEVQASNGASDYGNKFGEPVVTGFTRSFGMRIGGGDGAEQGGERREYVKPIMFSAGIGQMRDEHKEKQKPTKGMVVVKIGGPAYRIGMGGGAASSRVQDAKNAGLDFNAVQRGDAEMENKMNRVIRACIEMGDKNPIMSIHDQGAGGNGNVLKEIVDPEGALLEVRELVVGDESLSVTELWGAEYQENCALLLPPERVEEFKQICLREQCPAAFLGQVTGDGRIVLHDRKDNSTPVDLSLDLVLGKMPPKTFRDQEVPIDLRPLTLPENLTVADALNRVLRLLSVGSKRFLTNKVDRCVTGLIAQQQCVGPLHTPLADVAVVAHTLAPLEEGQKRTGTATAVGEQPVKGLVDPAAMARMTVAEAVSNLVWARVTSIDDVKCSANWMWAAKLPGEACKMYKACQAMRDVMLSLGISVDGGKDSLSMAAEAGGEVVKAPGTLVVTLYGACPDVELTVTPDLKNVGQSELLLIHLNNGNHRLGGSALAQVYKQVGQEVPDLEEPGLLRNAFNAVQELLDERAILSGHDRSDGGLLTCVLEMAFAGNCGVELALQREELRVDARTKFIDILFAEEVGFVLEVEAAKVAAVRSKISAAGVGCSTIGRVLSENVVKISVDGQPLLEDSMTKLRQVWEATSFQLERLQANKECVEQEEAGLNQRTLPAWDLTFTPTRTASALLSVPQRPKVAILRGEGSNGDREMAAAFHNAGVEAWDVSMVDLMAGNITLDRFRGVVFVGGFSYADVLDSGKGWAGTIRFSESVRAQFASFRNRQDSFSLGVCNGCQLSALLGWVPGLRSSGMDQESGNKVSEEESQPRFIENVSGRFECRFSSVRIMDSPSVLLQGMSGSVLGVWIAHGEGRMMFPSPAIREQTLARNLAPLRYVDDEGQPTEEYPFNPNGSVMGIAGLCSEDGRHLALMPHPERCFMKWQWPWMPKQWRDSLQSSPWMQLFQNAANFCREE